jgi:putative sigma-54 modulation protein
MNVTVKGRGVDVTPAMRDYAQKKLNKLSEFDSDIRSAEVTSKSEHNDFKIEVMIIGDGLRIRAEERRPDYYEAVDFVIEKLEQQVKKHHKRQIERSRNHSARQVPAAFAAAAAPNPADYAEPAAEDGAGEEGAAPEQDSSLPRIRRTKRFAGKPMSATDAAIEMEMLGHQFFVFRTPSGDVNVVYHRHDGSVGLIEVGE